MNPDVRLLTVEDLAGIAEIQAAEGNPHRPLTALEIRFVGEGEPTTCPECGREGVVLGRVNLAIESARRLACIDCHFGAPPRVLDATCWDPEDDDNFDPGFDADPSAVAADSLAAIGCPAGPDIIASWSEAQTREAICWAESIWLGDRPLPPRPAFLAAHDVRRCRLCGCTEDRACEGGCHWAGPDVCSACADLAEREGA